MDWAVIICSCIAFFAGVAVASGWVLVGSIAIWSCIAYSEFQLRKIVNDLERMFER